MPFNSLEGIRVIAQELIATISDVEHNIRKALPFGIYPRMWHVWQINLLLPQARQSLDGIAQFLKSHEMKVMA